MPNPNHPKKGASTKASPIRSLDAIQSIKRDLQYKPRDLCLFTMGINTAYRACELLSLRIGQVRGAKIGDALDLKQSKTSEYRATVLNAPTIETLEFWLAQHPMGQDPDAPLFMSNHYLHNAITVARLIQLVKQWCFSVGLSGNFSSHTLRKTWGYHQRVKHGVSVALITRAYGHATEAQTLEYLGILSSEIRALYLDMEL